MKTLVATLVGTEIPVDCVDNSPAADLKIIMAEKKRRGRLMTEKCYCALNPHTKNGVVC